ncbi:MAG: MoaD/ThiS family protein [Oscillospiraceae bacterium]|jgi:molybdopterin converting factor small subunit|nr:MoaD/ThiS family protein [Oscillospiraceae bacterium]
MKVKLFATLRDGRGKEAEISWFEGIDGFKVLEELDLKQDDVKIFLVNGFHSTPDKKLNPEDQISLFPAVGGG